MRYLDTRNELTAVASSIDLRAPELHDFSDLPATRSARLVAVAMVVVLALGVGHVLYQAPTATADANPPASVESRG